MDAGTLDRRLGAALAALNGVFLVALGLVAGIAVGLSVSWLSWLWQADAVGRLLAGAAVLLILAALYAATRTLGWSIGARWGPGAFGLGWILASFALTGLSFGGDILVTSTLTNHLFLYGGVAAVVLGTVRTPERGGSAQKGRDST